MKKYCFIASITCLILGIFPLMTQADTVTTTDVQVVLSKKLTPGVLPDDTPVQPSVDDQTLELPKHSDSVGSSSIITIAPNAYSSVNTSINSITEKLPKTGEQVNSLIYSLLGGLCLFIVFLLIPRRYKGGN